MIRAIYNATKLYMFKVNDSCRYNVNKFSIFLII